LCQATTKNNTRTFCAHARVARFLDSCFDSFVTGGVPAVSPRCYIGTNLFIFDIAPVPEAGAG
jgi:hypothetical protein